MEKLLVQRISLKAKIPVKSTVGAAGLDLFCVEDHVLLPLQRKLMSTDLIIQLPIDSYGRVAPRSGLSLQGIDVSGGVIDSDYRGVVKILLVNNSPNTFKVNCGDRVAQLIIEKICAVDLIEVENLPSTERGAQGFGSTAI